MKKALRVLAWLGIVLALQEISLRFFIPLPELRQFNRINYMPRFVYMQDVGAIRSVDLANESLPDGAAFTARLNSYGFRDQDWSLLKPPGTRRVMFVGDSFVEGIMAAENETIPRLFQNLAERNGLRAQVMNCGVTAADAHGYFRLLADAAPWFEPDWVVLVFFANDFAAASRPPPGTEVARWRGTAPRLWEIVRMIRNREMLPFRWPFRTIRLNQPVPHPNNPFSDPAYERQAAGLVSERILQAMKSGRFNPYRPGCSWWYEEALRSGFDFRPELERVRDGQNKRGGRLLVAYIPERRQVTNFYKQFEKEYSPDDFDLTLPVYQGLQRQLAEQCAQLGIPFLDLSRAIAAEERRDDHLYWSYDDHLKSAGNRLVAQVLFETWADLERR